MARSYSVPAVRRAIQVLEILANSHTGLSLAELSRSTSIPKSSLFRILNTLEHHSVVLQDEQRETFTLGMKLIDWGNRALDKIDLKTVSHPHLIRMAHETRESYYVAILDDSEVIVIDRADTPEMWQMVARLGQRSPVHATASGQILISEMSAPAINALINRHGLRKFTGRTITTRESLEKRLRQVRAKGFVVADAEYKPDLCVIAVPIRDHHGRITAALMTAMPSERARTEPERVNEVLSVLEREAVVISREIGYSGPPPQPQPLQDETGRKAQ
jgi:DNA-binding IclR family transcriptional regulator